MTQGDQTTGKGKDQRESGRRIAMVVGVNTALRSYQPKLEHPVDDGRAIADVLQQAYCGFELPEGVLLEGRATSDVVKRAVRNLLHESKESDFLLFYFSGHSVPMRAEAGRLEVYLYTSDFAEWEVEMEEEAICS